MTVKLAEVGKKISAANQAQVKAVIEALSSLLDVGEPETPETTESREAALKIGPVATMADVKRAMNRLIAYIPNATTREQLEGDGDGDGEDEDKDGNEGAVIQGAVGQQIEAVRIAETLDLIQEAVLSTADRKSLNKSDFAIPEKAPGSGSYPIHDEDHARNALARAAGKSEESRVRAAVKKRYPDIGGKEAPAKEAGVTCADCGEPVGRYDDFCGNCGAGLNRNYGKASLHCVGCGATINDGQKFCSGCGTESSPSETALKKTKESVLSEAMKTHAPHADNFKAMSVATQVSHLQKMHGVSEVSGDRTAKHNSDHAAANDNDADDQKESVVEVELSTDFIRLEEKAIGRDGTLQIKLIRPGWGSSGYYSANLLERDGPRAYPSGSKMYWNHPTDDEERQRPERDLRDLAAVTVNDAKYLQEGPSGPGLYAIAKPVSTYANAIEELAPHIGTSILATGKGKKGEAEGKKGLIVESIVKGKSCDFVTEPGAGGEICQLFESVRVKPNNDHPKEDDYDVDELREAQKRLREVESERDRLQVRLLLRDAKEMATDELSRVENLPAPTIRKLAESLAKDPPADEDGELDKRAFRKNIKEAVQREAEYLESIVGSGRVRGIGRSNENWDRDDDDDDDDFSESNRKHDDGFDNAMAGQFSRLGLDENISKQAATGRR